MDNYKKDIRRAAVDRWPGNSSSLLVPVSVTLTYFYTNDLLDVDNVIKPVLDQLKMLVYVDDKQVTSVTSRKISIVSHEAVFANASSVLVSGLRSRSDFLHVLVEWE